MPSFAGFDLVMRSSWFSRPYILLLRITIVHIKPRTPIGAKRAHSNQLASINPTIAAQKQTNVRLPHRTPENARSIAKVRARFMYCSLKRGISKLPQPQLVAPSPNQFLCLPQLQFR